MNNTESVVTVDLSKFGYREMTEAAILLKAYVENNALLNDGVTLNFNMNSGNVFLSDEDYNVAMMNGKDIELFYSCPECGQEGFKDELREEGKVCCQSYLQEMEGK